MEKNSKHYEIIVLGDGAGAGLARNLAKFGKKVALIGHGRPGGTCLNRGCIPSKKLIAPTFKVYSAIKTLNKLKKDSVPLEVKDFINFKTLREEVNREVTNDSLESKQNMESGNVKNLTYYASHASFLDDSTLQLEDSTQLSFDKIVITTGSESRFPQEIKGIENVQFDTSTEALFTQDEFNSYTVLGGGVIGCELGAVYAACGIDVTILSLGNILRPIDDMIKPQVEKYLKSLGINIIKGIEIEEVKEISPEKYKNENEIGVSRKNGKIEISYLHEKLAQTHITDRLLVALGITPNSTNIGLENTSIKTNKRGFIEADDNFKVNESTFAIGDVSGKSLLRHGAGFEAREVFKQIIRNETNTLSQSYMPYGIYLGESEIGGVGKTVYQLKKEERKFKTYRKKFENTVYGKAKGLVGEAVIHYDEETFEILGSHVFGPDGVNLNQIIVPYIEHQKTLFDLADTICPHPSLAEGLFTIGIREVVYDKWFEEEK